MKNRVNEQKYTRYSFPSRQEIILCEGCLLEEFLVPGGLGQLPNLAEEVNLSKYLSNLEVVEAGSLEQDKYCPNCNYRLAFLKLITQAA